MKSCELDFDVVQSLHQFHLRAFKFLGHRCRAHRPSHDVDIVAIQQTLKPAQFNLVPFGVIAIEESAHQIICLTRAAMPATELCAGNAGFECQCFRHMKRATIAGTGTPCVLSSDPVQGILSSWFVEADAACTQSSTGKHLPWLRTAHESG